MRSRRGFGCALVACIGVLLLHGCADQTSSAAADYVLLLDDDSQPDQVHGEAGSYALTARGDGTPPLGLLDVPAGFENFGFFALVPQGFFDDSEEDTPYPFRAVNYWTVHGVFTDPCDRHAQGAREIGGSVDDLVRALRAQRLTSTSPPAPVTLDGHDGIYVELTVPRDVSFENCDQGYYYFWEGRPGDAQHVADSPGAVERVWILDVDGERAVLTAISALGVSDEQVEELTEMVESVRFVAPAS